jgi:ribonuclease P protein component
MLERRHRLTDSSDFSTATRRGRRAGTRSVVLHLAIRGDGAGRPDRDALTAEPRVGFVVSKAVGDAVVRNRVKRRLRHVARSRLTALPDHALLVVRALPGAADATYHALIRDFDGALRRLDPGPGAVDAGAARTGVRR